MTLHRLHALSAVLIAAFVCLHIANHLAGLAGAAAHIAFMEAARPVYRFLLVELALLSCIAFQVVSGLVFVIQGWKQRHGFIPWLQAVCGAYLSFFLVVHVGAVLFGRAALDLDTNFHFAAAGFHVAPFQFFFAPYYFFAVVALFTHLGCAAYWHSQSRPRVTRVLMVALPAAVGAVVSLLIVLSLAGALFPVDVPAHYKASYASSNHSTFERQIQVAQENVKATGTPGHTARHDRGKVTAHALSVEFAWTPAGIGQPSKGKQTCHF